MAKTSPRDVGDLVESLKGLAIIIPVKQLRKVRHSQRVK